MDWGAGFRLSFNTRTWGCARREGVVVVVVWERLPVHASASAWRPSSLRLQLAHWKAQRATGSSSGVDTGVSAAPVTACLSVVAGLLQPTCCCALCWEWDLWVFIKIKVSQGGKNKGFGPVIIAIRPGDLER